MPPGTDCRTGNDQLGYGFRTVPLAATEGLPGPERRKLRRRKLETFGRPGGTVRVTHGRTNVSGSACAVNYVTILGRETVPQQCDFILHPSSFILHPSPIAWVQRPAAHRRVD